MVKLNMHLHVLPSIRPFRRFPSVYGHGPRIVPPYPHPPPSSLPFTLRGWLQLSHSQQPSTMQFPPNSRLRPNRPPFALRLVTSSFVLVGGMASQAVQAMLPKAPSTKRSAVCMVRPPEPRICTDDCSAESCNWFTSLLEMVVPPSEAKAIDTNKDDILNALMSDLEKVEDKEKAGWDSFRYPPADRIIAIGDVHGDVDAMRSALRTSGLIDEKDKWTGGKSVLVQVGDQLDRGNREREIYELLFKLQDSAPAQGGAVHILLGNHELMNSRLDFRYVTRGGFEDFSRDGGVTKVFGQKTRAQIPSDVMRDIRALPAGMRARAKSLCQGGPLAMELAERAKISVMVGDNIFVHGGIHLGHLRMGGKDPSRGQETLRELNDDTKEFLLGKGGLPALLRGGGSPVWLRDYSRPHVNGGSDACKMLSETLKMVGARRMIVGHTPQAIGINSACGGRVWRIDTGMSAAYGGVPEAIEISKRGMVRIFTPEGVVQGSARFK